MSRVFLRKLIGLGRDEDGAALVITLALLMFMYVTCAGVFAIGQSVKDKIHLQNACDAAAYSAAVVQADTLSRIATINKAMSWTYVSMVRRQEDYIVNRWLTESTTRYIGDMGRGEVSADEAGLLVGMIDLNGSHRPFVLATVLPKLVEFLSQKPGESFYSTHSMLDLRQQIEDDKGNISHMNEAEDALLGALAARIELTVKDILKMNVSADDAKRCRFHFEQGESSSYLEHISDEERFTRFSDLSLSSDDKPNWFPRDSPSAEGFYREYSQRSNHLYAEWWIHPSGLLSVPIHRWLKGDGTSDTGVAFVPDSAYKGKRANPYVLKKDYFGRKGTITVGLAKYNENPWYRVFGDAAAAVAGAGDKLGGIFAAFNPYKHVEWSWAFSSAKAGYRYKNEEYKDEDPDSNQPKRAYRVDWANDRDWNLCVSDWDAVFVPVRSARMKAENGNWVENGNEDFLRGWVENGNWQPLDGSARHDYAVAGKMPGLPQMHKSGSGLDWKRLADLLYH